ncbi:hypothetical protein B0H19DRAFT_1377543 [Mycena capillaripes]|nr:hypothetical protein B0H19DRAFT_1377543 [Mycena capillaripes]
MDPSDSRSDIAINVLGGWDLAICAVLFFQGVLCSQLVHYTRVNKHDSVWLKLFVAGLALLTTLKTIQALAMLWIQNVTMSGDLDTAAALWEKNWLFHLSLMSSAGIAFYVQTFFCYRLWAICRNVYLVVSTLALFILALTSAAVAVFFAFTDMHKSIYWIDAHLGAGMSGDFLLTGGIVFCLLRHSKVVLPRRQTARMLDSLLRLTIQSAAPASACALINFIATMQLSRTGDWVRTEMLLSDIANMMLPKMYAISAMWTLNSRQNIRAEIENGPTMQTLDLEAVVGRISGDTDTALDVVSGPRIGPQSGEATSEEKVQIV